ncbi:polysaccharide deacetylase family protein [Psychrosphaera ytuae]|uniref:Polysaccharide deacetylase family protein n=1 Tax=Psychrosphaera ytuae TaxID=2820710 RepID=A0A975DAC7_9GAMM|nr:polysaccharide deacetylase family protein [Psychrosphaera ytuae]QTH63114.1 polysaccharide deacetylase family protein [Psychrosphaera ytuae]
MLKFGLSILAWMHFLRLKEHPFGILYFHRVLKQAEPFCPDDWTENQFEQLVAVLSKQFNILPISEALELQRRDQLPAKTLCLSFDDGYQDNATLAAPILEKYGVRGSFFVATEGTERGYLWNDELAYFLGEGFVNTSKPESIAFEGTEYNLKSVEHRSVVYLDLVGKLKVLPNNQRDQGLESIKSQLGATQHPPRCMMTTKQLQSLQDNGHDIGAHTHSHSILSYQSSNTARSEMTQSINYLNQVLDKPVTLFAYPNGWVGRDFTIEHERLLEELGLEYGVATNDGGVTTKTRKTAIPRFMPYRKQLDQFCLSAMKIMGET